jgi:hypothetical protein
MKRSTSEGAILKAGAKLTAKYGAANVTRAMVARACECTGPLVSHYMGNNSVARKAYEKEAKRLNLKLPDKNDIEAIGKKLRAKGPKKAA